MARGASTWGVGAASAWMGSDPSSGVVGSSKRISRRQPGASVAASRARTCADGANLTP
jgi:hypothetical protein